MTRHNKRDCVFRLKPKGSVVPWLYFEVQTKNTYILVKLAFKYIYSVCTVCMYVCIIVMTININSVFILRMIKRITY